MPGVRRATFLSMLWLICFSPRFPLCPVIRLTDRHGHSFAAFRSLFGGVIIIQGSGCITALCACCTSSAPRSLEPVETRIRSLSLAGTCDQCITASHILSRSARYSGTSAMPTGATKAHSSTFVARASWCLWGAIGCRHVSTPG